MHLLRTAHSTVMHPERISASNSSCGRFAVNACQQLAERWSNPQMASEACARIAASYTTKAFGIKTGTLMREARKTLPRRHSGAGQSPPLHGLSRSILKGRRHLPTGREGHVSVYSCKRAFRQLGKNESQNHA
jgi:nucleotidyltransferase/DNA polymerase involved in DNA repair